MAIICFDGFGIAMPFVWFGAAKRIEWGRQTG